MIFLGLLELEVGTLVWDIKGVHLVVVGAVLASFRIVIRLIVFIILLFLLTIRMLLILGEPAIIDLRVRNPHFLLLLSEFIAEGLDIVFFLICCLVLLFFSLVLILVGVGVLNV